jgi:hypothetical protein
MMSENCESGLKKKKLFIHQLQCDQLQRTSLVLAILQCLQIYENKIICHHIYDPYYQLLKCIMGFKS